MSTAAWYAPGGASGVLEPKAAWNRVVIDGFVLPGHASITTANLRVREDKKGGAGQQGALPTFHGLQPQQVEILVFVWTKEQADQMAGWCTRYAPAPGIKPQPLSIAAEAIKHLWIDHVVVTNVSLFKDATEGSARGKSLTITTQHWLAPAAAGKKKAKNTPTDTKNQRRDAAAADSNPAPSSQKNFCSPDDIQSVG